jgi:hypothetical protein
VVFTPLLVCSKECWEIGYPGQISMVSRFYYMRINVEIYSYFIFMQYIT